MKRVMSTLIHRHPEGDPLLASQSLDQCITLFPLGFPVTIETNSKHVLSAARESWSQFSKIFDEEPLQISIAVSDLPAIALPPPPVCRSRRHLFSVVSDTQNFFNCDFVRGYQFGWISQAVARDPAFFRYYFLEVAALTMLQQRYLAPVHGACVARNEKGVLLCGPSSAGKSTLAYACGRAGWTYISDDATLLVRSRTDHYAIGNRHSIRFRAGSRTLFPELTGHRPRPRANGTSRIEISTNNLPITTAAGCCVADIVFLQRSSISCADLQRSSGDRAFEWFASFATFGHPAFREEQTKCYQRLASVNVWTLRYSEPADAVALLERTLV